MRNSSKTTSRVCSMLSEAYDAARIELSVKERITLENLRKGRKSPVRAKERAAMILLAADGLEQENCRPAGAGPGKGWTLAAAICADGVGGHSQG